MNFLKATKEKFLELRIEITTERQLPNGEYIRHFELTDPMWVQAFGKSGYSALTDEQIREAYPTE